MSTLLAVSAGVKDQSPVCIPSRLTWERLVELEPRLGELYREVSAIRDTGGEWFCANHVWDEWHEEWDNSFKGRLFRLVGFAADSPDPVVRSREAARLAHDKIYGALPDCRACVCWGFQALIDECIGRTTAQA